MYKYLLLSISLFILAACSSTVTGEDGSEQPEELINAPADNSVQLKDLVGVWEIVEVRKNPFVKGRKVNSFQLFTWLGVNEDANFATDDSQEGVVESLDLGSQKVKMRDGWIVADNEMKFQNNLWQIQWGKQGIAVIEVKDNRAIIAFNMGGGDLKRYQVMVRRE